MEKKLNEIINEINDFNPNNKLLSIIFLKGDDDELKIVDAESIEKIGYMDSKGLDGIKFFSVNEFDQNGGKPKQKPSKRRMKIGGKRRKTNKKRR